MKPQLSGATRFSVGRVCRVILNKQSVYLSSLLDDPNDAFWLAQTYFMQNQYARAERLLTRPFSTSSPVHPSTPPLLTNGDMSFNNKGKGREQDMPPMPIPRLPLGPKAMVEQADTHEGVSRLVDMSVACRYLAAQCLVRQGNWNGATEMLGEANPFRDSGRNGPAIPNIDGGIKVRPFSLLGYSG